MLTVQIRTIAAGFCVAGLFVVSAVNAEDWARQTYDVEGVKNAYLTFEYPMSWGKKPKYTAFDNVTNLAFGPYGPKAKPVFLVQLQSVPTIEPISAEQLQQITEAEVSQLAKIAFESEISVNALQGEHNDVRYFSITDKEKKWGEFDYLTMAIVASGSLLTKCYFFSSDGAPDFGADAIRMMESIKYTPPPVEPDEDN